jgi:hypothetical protein
MATIKNPEVTKELPVEEVTNKKEKTDDKVSKAQFEQLQETYRMKCLDYDKLLNAYRSLALRYTRDGEAARQFIKTALLGINLVFPEDNKGE